MSRVVKQEEAETSSNISDEVRVRNIISWNIPATHHRGSVDSHGPDHHETHGDEERDPTHGALHEPGEVAEHHVQPVVVRSRVTETLQGM